MMSKSRKLVLMALVALLIAATAQAELFRISMQNGNQFETRYVPREAPYDASKWMFLSDTGNWVAVPKGAVKGIESVTEARGFGRVIDNRTIVLGEAPNDKPTPEQLAAQQQQQGFRNPFLIQRTNYTSPLVGEPNAGTGIPLDFINQVTPPLSGGGASVINQGGGAYGSGLADPSGGVEPATRE